ncbi:hypothetical protein CSV76_16200, partial [Sporosarcina sp. P17b]
PPLVGSWLEAIPHVPARVQSMTLTTFNEQANLEQRPNLSPNDLAKTEESYHPVTGFHLL